MATSGSSDFSETARQVITSAFELVNSNVGNSLDANDAEKGREQLNLMLKTWGADPDPKLWQMTEGSVTLIASTASYVLPAARKVISVRRRTGSVDVPLLAMSRQEYYDFPTKSAVGVPFSYYFDPQRAARTLYVVNVPDATTAAAVTLPYTYLRVIEDIDALDDDFDVPQEWFEVLQYGLAARLSLVYRKHLGDPVGAAEVKQRAAELYQQLSSFDDESTSVFFQPA